MHRSPLFLLAFACVVGCSDPYAAPKDGGAEDGAADGVSLDGSTEDSSEPVDGSVEDSTSIDTGTPPPIDTGTPPPVDTGTVTDTGGGYCPTNGATETVACGKCGTQLRVCSSNTWVYATCMEKGVCTPGSTETVTCPSGGSGTRYCDTMCAWQTTCSSSPLDVIILFDTTGSFTAATSATNKAAIMTKLVNPLLASKTYDVRVGVVSFKDTDATDKLVEGKLVPSNSSASISAAINALTSAGGGDVEEGGVLALSEVAGGKVHTTSTPLVCPSGTSLGGCFRTGAKKIVVVVSDALQHNAPNGSGGFVTPYTDATLETWASTSSRLTSNAISVFALTDSTSSAMWGAMETSLGSTLAARVVYPATLISITDWSTQYASLLTLIKSANPGL